MVDAGLVDLRFTDLGDALVPLCRNLDLRSMVMLSSASQSLRYIFQQRGPELAGHAEARVTLRCKAMTSTAGAVSLARCMLAWRVRRLRLALLIGPGEEMLRLLGPSLESLAVAPMRHVLEQPDGCIKESSDGEQEGKRVVEEEEEEQHPGWTFGSGPVGALLHLPADLVSLEAGALVQCPIVALASAPGLRHVTLDAASGCRELLEEVRSLPPLLQSLTLTFGGSPLADITGRVLHLPSLLQHNCLQRLAFRLDTPELPEYAQVLLDGSPAELHQLSSKVDLELRLGSPEQQVDLVLMPKMWGMLDPAEEGAIYSITSWEAGRLVGCRLQPIGEDGEHGDALAWPVKVHLPGERVAWCKGVLQGQEGSMVTEESVEGYQEIDELDFEGLYVTDSE